MLSTTAEPHFFLPAGVGSLHLHKCVRNNPTNIVSDSFYFFNGLSVFISFCVVNKIAYKANDYPQSKPLLFEPSTHGAENKKKPSRERLRDGLLYALKYLNPLKSRLFGNEKGSIFFYQNMLPFLAERGGFEPPHGN